MKDLRIVIPAYNEEASIAEVISRVRKACPEAEVIIVDDGSKDRTAEIVGNCGVKVISNHTNLGKGGATKVGFVHNLNNGINYLAFIDADGTYPPERIPELYDLCKQRGYDMAVGSRLVRKNNGMPRIRILGNKIFAGLLTFYSGKRTTDTSTGLRVFNVRLLPMIETLPNGLDFDTSMTTKALFGGLAYVEVPIEYNRRAGTSKLNNLKDGYRFLRVIMNATRQHKPWLFYFTLGIPFLVVNLLVKNRL
jgi:glycosyltransferase involved in cell wall biosynthesis